MFLQGPQKYARKKEVGASSIAGKHKIMAHLAASKHCPTRTLPKALSVPVETQVETQEKEVKAGSGPSKGDKMVATLLASGVRSKKKTTKSPSTSNRKLQELIYGTGLTIM